MPKLKPGQPMPDKVKKVLEENILSVDPKAIQAKIRRETGYTIHLRTIGRYKAEAKKELRLGLDRTVKAGRKMGTAKRWDGDQRTLVIDTSPGADRQSGGVRTFADSLIECADSAAPIPNRLHALTVHMDGLFTTIHALGSRLAFISQPNIREADGDNCMDKSTNSRLYDQLGALDLRIASANDMLLAMLEDLEI